MLSQWKMRQMDLNLNTNLRTKYLNRILIFSILIFLMLIAYNYVIKPVDIEISIQNLEDDNNSQILIILPKNHLNFQVPFLLNEINIDIKDGSNLVEFNRINERKILIRQLDTQSEGRISILISIPDRKIKKVLELYIASQKVWLWRI